MGSTYEPHSTGADEYPTTEEALARGTILQITDTTEAIWLREDLREIL